MAVEKWTQKAESLTLCVEVTARENNMPASTVQVSSESSTMEAPLEWRW